MTWIETNLQLISVGQIRSGDSESSRSDLLDGRTAVEFRILVEIPDGKTNFKLN